MTESPTPPLKVGVSAVDARWMPAIPSPKTLQRAHLLWLLSLAVALGLALTGVLAASASAASPSFPQFAPTYLEEEELEIIEGEGCFIEVEEFIEWVPCEEPDQEEISEAEAEERQPPPECALRTARARAFVSSSNQRLRLVIHYTANLPGNAAISARLKGHRGNMYLPRVNRRLGRSGHIALNLKLTDTQLMKARAARHLYVKIAVGNAPQYCQRYQTRQLVSQKPSAKRIVWVQSGSPYGG